MDIRHEIIKLMRKEIFRRYKQDKNIYRDYFTLYKDFGKQFAKAGGQIAARQIQSLPIQNQDKPIQFKITTGRKQSLDSIIMGQVSGIRAWDIEARLVKPGKTSRTIPMWQRTGKITWRTAKRPRSWKLYEPHTQLPFVHIDHETKHSLYGSVALRDLQQMVDKLTPWGIVNIKIKK